MCSTEDVPKHASSEVMATVLKFSFLLSPSFGRFGQITLLRTTFFYFCKKKLKNTIFGPEEMIQWVK